MTSAGPWGAIPQAQGVAHIIEETAEKIEKHIPQQIEDQLPLGQSSSSAATDASSDLEKDTAAQEVTKLARQLTQQSSGDDELGKTLTAQSAKTNGGNYRNSFLDASDPALDPNSGQFKPEKWVRTLVGLQSRDPERYPQRVAGISYKDLNVHGFGSLTDYQKYVRSNVFNRSMTNISLFQDLWQLPSRDRLHLQQTYRTRQDKDSDIAEF